MAEITLKVGVAKKCNTLGKIKINLPHINF